MWNEDLTIVAVSEAAMIVVWLYCWLRIPVRKLFRGVIATICGLLAFAFFLYGLVEGWVVNVQDDRAPYWRTYLVIFALFAVIDTEVFRSEIRWGKRNHITDDRASWRMFLAVLLQIPAVGFGAYTAEALTRCYL